VVKRFLKSQEVINHATKRNMSSSNTGPNPVVFVAAASVVGAAATSVYARSNEDFRQKVVGKLPSFLAENQLLFPAPKQEETVKELSLPFQNAIEANEVVEVESSDKEETMNIVETVSDVVAAIEDSAENVAVQMGGESGSVELEAQQEVAEVVAEAAVVEEAAAAEAVCEEATAEAAQAEEVVAQVPEEVSEEVAQTAVEEVASPTESATEVVQVSEEVVEAAVIEDVAEVAEIPVEAAVVEKVEEVAEIPVEPIVMEAVSITEVTTEVSTAKETKPQVVEAISEVSEEVVVEVHEAVDTEEVKMEDQQSAAVNIELNLEELSSVVEQQEDESFVVTKDDSLAEASPEDFQKQAGIYLFVANLIFAFM